MKKHHSFKGTGGRIASNLLELDFKSGKPNQKWVNDVTVVDLFGINLYFSLILIKRLID